LKNSSKTQEREFQAQIEDILIEKLSVEETLKSVERQKHILQKKGKPSFQAPPSTPYKTLDKNFKISKKSKNRKFQTNFFPEISMIRRIKDLTNIKTHHDSTT
jgi:phosphatidate phosphatase APP1